MSLERITNSARMSVIMGAATGYIAAMYVASVIGRGVRVYRSATAEVRRYVGHIDESAHHPGRVIFGNASRRDYQSVNAGARAASDFGHNPPDADVLPSNEEVIAGVEKLLHENERNYH